MNARKCDRCKNLFERMTVTDITIEHYFHGYGEFRYDLCPNCQREIENWLKMVR